MKHIILSCIIGVLTVGLAFSQDEKEKVNPKKVEKTFRVEGKCGMCKDRIEEAVDVKGVKYADWNVESKMLKVIYNSEKISLEEIKKHIADAGHDTEDVKAGQEAYDDLHGCCKYRKE